jgi:hypothetical protein
MSELRKPLIGLAAALLALVGAIILGGRVEAERGASLSEAAAPSPPA